MFNKNCTSLEFSEEDNVNLISLCTSERRRATLGWRPFIVLAEFVQGPVIGDKKTNKAGILAPSNHLFSQ